LAGIKDARALVQRFCVRLINASHKTFNILNQSWLLLLLVVVCTKNTARAAHSLSVSFRQAPLSVFYCCSGWLVA
jgi:hypothetical protein